MVGKGIWKRRREIIEDELDLSIPIAGLAKDDKHQTAQLLYGNPIEMIPLKRTSEAFYLVTANSRRSAPFAITFHQATARNEFIDVSARWITRRRTKKENNIT